MFDLARYRFRRGAALERCLKFRGWIKEGDKTVHGVTYSVEFMTFLLRRDQMILLKLRIWLTTGTYPRDDN